MRNNRLTDRIPMPVGGEFKSTPTVAAARHEPRLQVDHFVTAARRKTRCDAFTGKAHRLVATGQNRSTVQQRAGTRGCSHRPP